MSLTTHNTKKRSVAQKTEPAYVEQQIVSTESHIHLSAEAGKREVKIPTKVGFFLGFISALLVVILILVLLL